jgi:glycolate oxidase FAD binding subunit
MGTHSSSPSSRTSDKQFPPHANSLTALEPARPALERLLGSENIRLATPADFVDDFPSHFVVAPDTSEKVAATLKFARDAGLHVIPRGNGTKKNWGNPPRAGEIVLSLGGLNRIVEHAWGDMTATVEAGCSFADLQTTLAQHGQRLALNPLWPDRATIGGILAANDSGPLRVRFGSLRDLVIGITLALPDGSLARSGGKVVKNVAGYDLPKLATGSMGTLGVITQATFRLHPLPRETRTLSFALENFTEMNRFLLAIHDCSAVPTGAQIRAAKAQALEVDIGFEGTPSGCEAQIDQIAALANFHGATRRDRSDPVWQATEKLWVTNPPSAICKFTLLPSEIATFLHSLTNVCKEYGLSWKIVAQSVGVGYLSLESPHPADLVAALETLRSQLESRLGSLVLLNCPPEFKTKLDVWGSATDALPLMRGIKQQFDPAGVLNPGRFQGNI